MLLESRQSVLTNNRASKGLRLGHPHRPVFEDVFQGMLQVTSRSPCRVTRIVYPSFVAKNAPAVQHKDVGGAYCTKGVSYAVVFVLEVGEVEALLLRPSHHLREGISRGQVGIIGVDRHELHPPVRIRILKRAAAACASWVAAMAATRYSRVQMTWSAHSLRRLVLRDHAALLVIMFFPFCCHREREGKMDADEQLRTQERQQPTDPTAQVSATLNEQILLFLAVAFLSVLSNCFYTTFISESQ